MEDPYKRIQEGVTLSVSKTNKPLDIIRKVFATIIIVFLIIAVFAKVMIYRTQEMTKAVQIDTGVVTTKVITMPAVWTKEIVIPDRAPWIRIFPQDGNVHYFVKVHHRFSGDWQVFGPYTRSDNTNLGDNIDMVEFMSAETLPITVTVIVQKP